MNLNLLSPQAKATIRRHVIVEVHFEPRTNDGPLDCACGQHMQASEYANHRRELGLGWAKSGILADGSISAWTRTSRCRMSGCDSPIRAKGLCSTHYNRTKRNIPLADPVRYRRQI